MVDKAARRARILQIFGTMGKSDCAKVLAGWEPGELLGEGTVGTVWMACRKGRERRRCGALKVQEITSLEEERRWRAEVDTQRRFFPFAPEIMSSCMLGSRYPKYSAIVMEVMEETLYERLGKSMSGSQVDEIGHQVLDICRFLAAGGSATHGDLALFNLAFDGQGRLKMIDFDRAYTPPLRGRAKLDAKLSGHVDFYRLQLEFYKSTQSHDERQVKMPPKVLRAFRDRWVPQWALAFQLNPARTARDAEDAWLNAYARYCKLARVLCLE